MKKVFFSLFITSFLLTALPIFADNEGLSNALGALRKGEENNNSGETKKHKKKKKGKKVSIKENDIDIDNDQDPDGENVILYLDRKESASEDTEGD